MERKSASTDNTPDISVLDAELKRLQLEDLREQMEKKKAEADRRKRLQQVRTADTLEQKARREAAQAGCSHVMPDGETTFGGQRCSDGKIRVVCGICGKLAAYEELSDREKMMVSRKIERGEIPLRG